MPFPRLLLSLASLACTCACSAPSGEVMPRYGPLDIDGEFGVRPLWYGGDFVTSDVGEAGFDEDRGVLGVRGDLDLGVPTLTVSLQGSTHSGVGRLAGALNDGTNYISGENDVASSLDFGLYQGLLTFDAVPSDVVDLGLGLGVTVVDFDGRITDTVTEVTISESQLVPVPVLALDAGARLGDFRAGATLSGVSIDLGGDDVALFDLDLTARYRLLGSGDRLSGSLCLGYRLIGLDVEYEDTEEILIDLRFRGPYLGVSLGF